MGLEMYAKVTTETPDQPVDFKIKGATELFYWCKHRNLHAWMHELYRAKGGVADCFNCVPVILDAEDIERLEADLRAGALSDDMDSFFDMSDGLEIEDDLEFIAMARAAIVSGKTVFYESWW